MIEEEAAVGSPHLVLALTSLVLYEFVHELVVGNAIGVVHVFPQGARSELFRNHPLVLFVVDKLLVFRVGGGGLSEGDSSHTSYEHRYEQISFH